MLKDLDEFLHRSSFKTKYDVYNPTFETSVSISRWLIAILDPDVKLIEINSQSPKGDKLTFVKEIVTYWYNNHGIVLDPVKLYKNDKGSLEELSKIVYYFKQCSTSIPIQGKNPGLFSFNDLDDINKDILKLLNEGASLFKDMGQENVNYGKLNELVKKEINPRDIGEGMRNIHASLEKEMEKLEVSMTNVKKEQNIVDVKIGQKGEELAKLKTRLESMVSLTPAHVEENERCLIQIRALNETYVRNFRNLRYLEKRAKNFLEKDSKNQNLKILW